jgi:hypothetical protein
MLERLVAQRVIRMTPLTRISGTRAGGYVVLVAVFIIVLAISVLGSKGGNDGAETSLQDGQQLGGWTCQYGLWAGGAARTGDWQQGGCDLQAVSRVAFGLRTGEVDARLVPLAETPQLAEGDTAPIGAGEPEHGSLDGGAVDGAWATGTQDVAVDIGKDGGGAVLPYVTAPNSIEGIICDRFGDSPYGCDYWIAVAFCESSLRPSAVGYAGRYTGLYQVWLGHGYPHDWLLDPYNNTLAAWELSREGTVTTPWPYCR